MKFNDLLNLRFKQKSSPETQKMTALVERSSKGDLSSFSGIFRVAPLSDAEGNELKTLLNTFRESEYFDIEPDLTALSALTSEVKAITNQAVILHGERIKKAQELLKKYRDGAFTAWLFATYGNRQTPYNFLQYYEFYTAMPSSLHTKIDQMPRQAIYSLASREGAMEKKEEIVQNYSGQPKKELLLLIRKEFPLAEEDKRVPNFAHHALLFLKRARESMKNPYFLPSEKERKQLFQIIQELQDLFEKS